jgi:hypothetical protein
MVADRAICWVRRGRQAVSARRDWRRHVGIILIVRASVPPELSFLYVDRSRISDLLLPILVFCCLLLDGRIEIEMIGIECRLKT